MDERGWALVRGARETQRRFGQGWDRLPDGALRRWMAVIVLGWLLGAGLAAGLSVLGERMAERGMDEWDRRTLLEIAADERFSFQTAIFLEGLGSSAMLIPLTALAVVLAARAQRPLVVAVLALVVSYACVRLGTHWLSDIGAGLLIGAFWLGMCVLALRRVEGRTADE